MPERAPPVRADALERRVSTLAALDHAAEALLEDMLDATGVRVIETRGHLRPAENEALDYWHARFHSVRTGLRQLISETLRDAGKRLPDVDSPDDWRQFAIAYASACQLVRLDLAYLERLAPGRVMQRKLNEPVDALRLPRKSYTRVFRAFVDQRDALHIRDAIRHAERYRHALDAFAADPLVGELVRGIGAREAWLDPSRRRYARRLARYVDHWGRRLGVVAVARALSRSMEHAGRAASEVGGRRVKRIGPRELAEIDACLEPGDVLVTRHDHVLTNLFLPGWWPHVALHVGSATERDARGIALDPLRRERWRGDRRTLEALKDGVRFRPLEETLRVDHVAILRPRLSASDIDRAISRIARHEGKPYNFDFDFFSADRLVCTEVVYRAYDGIGGIDLPLVERGGRRTLSAEDLIAEALAGRGFDAAGLLSRAYAAPRLIVGRDARERLLAGPPGRR